MSLLAKGCYRYALGGESQPIREPWQLHASDTGLQLTGQRLIDEHAALDVQAEFSGQQCRSLHMRWQARAQDHARFLSYRMRVDQQLNWQEDDQPTCTMALPPGTRLFALLRGATGVLLPQLTQTDSQVVLPNLRQPNDYDRFLTPLLSKRRAEPQGGPRLGLQHFRYFGGEYGNAGSDYWVDMHGLVQRYCWDTPQGEWTVELEDFQVESNFSWLSERS